MENVGFKMQCLWSQVLTLKQPLKKSKSTLTLLKSKLVLTTIEVREYHTQWFTPRCKYSLTFYSLGPTYLLHMPVITVIYTDVDVIINKSVFVDLVFTCSVLSFTDLLYASSRLAKNNISKLEIKLCSKLTGSVFLLKPWETVTW